MTLLPLRLRPGDRLRPALEQAVRDAGCGAAFVLSGIGSLSVASIRLAGASQTLELTGDHEILSLAGSIAAGPEGAGSHLHISLSDREGRVLGGHAGLGCIVNTTAEVLIALLPDWELRRESDETTGYAELTITPR